MVQRCHQNIQTAISTMKEIEGHHREAQSEWGVHRIILGGMVREDILGQEVGQGLEQGVTCQEWAGERH